MRRIVQRNQFRRNYKQQGKRGKNLDKLDTVVALLVHYGTLDQTYRPHKLTGEWLGKWEYHIEPDWLFIYEPTPEEIVLHRTGTHADLFE